MFVCLALLYILQVFVLVVYGYTFENPNTESFKSQDKAVGQRRKVGWIDPYSFEHPKKYLHNREDIVVSGEEPRKKEWIDPYDMGFKPKSQPPYNGYSGDNCRGNSKFYEVKHEQNDHCEVNLQRLVNSFLRSTSLLQNDKDMLDSSIRLHSSITARELKILKLFANHGKNKGGADIGVVCDIFHKVFVENIHYGKKEPSLLDKLQTGMSKALYKMAQSPELTVVSSVMAMLLATLWFLYKTGSYRLALFSLFITLFFAGFGFTWIRLYEEADVERFVNIKLHGEVPYHCSGKPMAWYEHMYYRTFGINCLEFYKSRDISPIAKISPTDVLSETISSMFMKPATNIGIAYGNFCHNVLDHLPWWLKPIAVPFVFLLPPLVFILVLALFLDYRFSISITGFHLIPNWCGKTRRSIENESGYVKEVPCNTSIFNSIFSDSKAPLFLVNWSGLQKLSSSKLLAEDKHDSHNGDSRQKLLSEDKHDSKNGDSRQKLLAEDKHDSKNGNSRQKLLAEDKHDSHNGDSRQPETSKQSEMSVQPKAEYDKEVVVRAPTTNVCQSIQYPWCNMSSDQGVTSERPELISSQIESPKNCCDEASAIIKNDGSDS